MDYVELIRGGTSVERRPAGLIQADGCFVVDIGPLTQVRVPAGSSITVGEHLVRHVKDDSHRVAPIEKIRLAAPPRPPMSGISGSPDAAMMRDAEQFASVEGYQVVGLLGRGGMGTVWRALQLSTRRPVALKLMRGHSFTTPRARLRFEREVELAARLEHPHIARVYHSGLADGVYFYAMELIEGVHLDQWVRDQKLTRAQILEIMRKVCDAVSFAHQRGVIHRDLKPSNILVDKDGEPHVLDFGLATSTTQDEKSPVVSMDGEVAGTLVYMAPEQAAGRMAEVDARSEVYTLGVILFELIVGRHPRDQAGTDLEMRRRIVEEEVPRPRKLDPSINAELETVIRKSLAHEPALRYASVADFSADLGNYLRGDPLIARPLTIGYFLRKRLWRYRGRVAIAASVLLVLLATGVFSYVNIVAARDRAEAAAEANRRSLYLTRIALANVQLQRGDLANTKDLLAMCPVDLRRWEWGRLAALVDASVLTLKSDRSRTLVARYEAGDTQVLTIRDNGLCQWWDASSGRLLNHVSLAEAIGSEKPIAAAITADGSRIAISTMTHILLVDAKTGQTIWSMDGSSSGLGFDRQGKWLSFTADHAVQIWDVQSRSLVREFPGAQLSRFVFNSEIIAIGNEKAIEIRSIVDGALKMSLPVSDETRFMDFDPTGQALVSVSDQATTVWNLRTGTPVTTLRVTGDDAPKSAEFSPDGSQLVTAGRDKMIRLWDCDTGAQVSSLRGQEGAIFTVGFGQTRNHLISMTQDTTGTVKLWDAGDSSDSSDSRIVHVPFKTERLLGPLTLNISDPWGAAANNRRLVLWNQNTGEQSDLPELAAVARSVAISDNGRLIACGEASEKGNQIEVLDVHTRARIALLPLADAPRKLEFSPDGRRLAVVMQSKTIVYDAGSWQVKTESG